jgi:hypothetical protein
LLLIRSLALDSEWDVLAGERLERGLGDDVFAGLKYPAGESAEEEAQRFPLGGTVFEGDDHHNQDRNPIAKGVHRNAVAAERGEGRSTMI